uniref:Coiled-coil domain containing 9 n=1 Tax=Leptobrachium leishanense TaxID=445787 RepID=A0A8C5MMR1_9ANUR
MWFQASVVDLKSKEEKDAELDRKIEALKKKNEALILRHQLIEEDKKRAELEGIAVTSQRKPKSPEAEPDKARKDKQNLSITLDVDAGEKRMINDGKPQRHSQGSPRSPNERKSGRIGFYSAGRSPSTPQASEPHVGDGDINLSSEIPARGRRDHGMETSPRDYRAEKPRRSPRGNMEENVEKPRRGPRGNMEEIPEQPRRSPRGSMEETPEQARRSPRSNMEETPEQARRSPRGNMEETPEQPRRSPRGNMEETPEQPRRSQRGNMEETPEHPRRAPRGNMEETPGERWNSSPRGGGTFGDRGGRGAGRGERTPARSGVPGPGGESSGPDRRVKEWEEKRRQNIEKMNEEMEKIAEYERSQRDGMREKNPIRNFLDDPRRTGPVADVDRKEGSRRHVRNWGGPDFEKVKTGLDREKESHVRRPSGRNQVDMTMSMTGRERAEYIRWKKEREQIDQERLERHRNQKGQWKREWDAEKNESMFKDEATPHVEESPASRRDKVKPGAPKPHTMGEYISDGLSSFNQKKDRSYRAGRNKSYNQHDSRWEKPEEPEETDLTFVQKMEKETVQKEEKETCVEKEEMQEVEEPMQPAKAEENPAEEEEEEEEDDDEEEEDDDDDDEEEWTDASGDDVEDCESVAEQHAKSLPVTPQLAPKERRPSPHHETPKLIIPPPSESIQDSKPTTPFSPEAHQSVIDWGEEMEQLSNRESSNEDGILQATRENDLSDSGSATPAHKVLQKVPEDLSQVLESESREPKASDGEADLVEVETPAGLAEEASMVELSGIPSAGGSAGSTGNGGEVRDQPSDVEEPEPALGSPESSTETLVEGPAPAMAAPIATVEQKTEVPPSS